MKKPVCLLLDVNNLAYRAHHSTGGFRYNGRATGVAYGVLREVANLMQLFSTAKVALCFDGHPGLRQAAVPAYKASRVPNPEVARQIDELRADLLPAVGLTDVRHDVGYEADDQIAAAVEAAHEDDDFCGKTVAVSGDRDLYQLLSTDRHEQWLPIKSVLITEADFHAEWGIHPDRWIDVKAIAGCGTDEIDGCKGVGEVTAAKWVRGDKVPPAAERRILEFTTSKKYAENLRLVQLPYLDGLTRSRHHPDTPISPDGWERVCTRLGLFSLIARVRRPSPLKKAK